MFSPCILVVFIHEAIMIQIKKHPILNNIYVSTNGDIWELYEGSQYTRDIHKRYPQCIRGHLHQDKYGYDIYTPRIPTCKLNNLQPRKKLKVHQLVAQTWIDNFNNLTIVDHINYKKKDNNVKNLRWVTLAENNKGKHRKVKNVSHEFRMVALRFLLVDNLSVKEVNKLTNITCNTLSEAKRGDIWFHEWQKVQRLGFIP
jgi:hypothetical protein